MVISFLQNLSHNNPSTPKLQTKMMYYKLSSLLAKNDHELETKFSVPQKNNKTIEEITRCFVRIWSCLEKLVRRRQEEQIAPIFKPIKTELDIILSARIKNRDVTFLMIHPCLFSVKSVYIHVE